MSNSLHNVLVIVGMHRSMTSLVTQWLHQCGLHVGDDLYGAGIGNVKGHYEDKDFIALHDYLLKINDSHWRNTSPTDFVYDDYSIEKSKMLIKLKDSLHGQWGWKDPRTCLFLDHWEGLLPTARYIVVYRPFQEVVDSLLRREFKVKNNLVYLLNLRKYVSKYLNQNIIKENNLKVWVQYNHEILQFISNVGKERFLVMRNDQLLKYSKQIFDHLRSTWNFNLEYTDIRSVYDSDITQKAQMDVLQGVNVDLLNQAKDIQSSLDEFCFVKPD